jgi:uncharacterized protein (TIGR03437 family)
MNLYRLAGLVAAPLLAAQLSAAEVRLPASMRLAGPINDALSSLGDEISHYPFGPGYGGGAIHGWIAIDFSPPKGRTAKFHLTWRTVGDEPVITFQTGHYVKARAVGCFNSGVQSSVGELDLDTGVISDLEVHAVFQNLLIDKTSRNNRFPLNSKGAKFTVLFGDYPPIDFPFTLPFSERPTTYTQGKFTTDAAGNITGFEFRGATFIPLAAVPQVALMPTYSFGPGGDTIVPGADGCLPGTTPADQCLSDERYPDGLALAYNAFLSPILVLSTQELRDPGPARSNPPATPAGAMVGAAAAALGGTLWMAGGLDGTGSPSYSVFALDSAGNRWTTMQNLPRSVWQACGAASGSRFYVMGGRESVDGPPVSTVHVLDTASGTWSETTLPVALAEAACAEVNGRIYVMGGWTAAPANSGAPSAGAWVFDPASTTWQALPDMPAPLAGAAVAVSGTDIFVVNGSQDGSKATDRVFVFSTATGVWSEAPPTNRAVYGGSAAVLSGRLFLAGGRTGPGAPLDVGNVHYLTQAMQMLVGSTWYAGLEPPLTAAGMAGGVVGDTWYLVGGDTSVTGGAPVPTRTVQAYTTMDGWLISDTYPMFIAEGVRNAAGLGGGPADLAPGTLASILGYHLAAATLTAPAVSRTGAYYTTDLPTELGGVQVNVDGQPAGLTAVAPDRIDFQVPFGIEAGPVPRLVEIQLSRDGVTAPPVFVPLVDAAPGLFVYSHGETRELTHLDGSGAVALNSDGGLNYGAHPAQRGTIVTLRATGLGDVDARPEPLQRMPRERVATALKTPEVLIDGHTALVESTRLVPGEAGIYEIRVQVPTESRTGLRVNVQLRSGSILSNRAVLVISGD